MSTKQPKPKAKHSLWWHPRGGWAKRILGKVYYYGRDEAAAVAKYNHDRPHREAGREPPSMDVGGLTVTEVANKFLHAKRQRVESGELTPRMWDEYRLACARMVDVFGRTRVASTLTPDDFGKLRADAASRVGPYALKKHVTLVRAVFAFAAKNRLIPVPADFGTVFDKPKRKDLALARRARGRKLVAAADLRLMIDAADEPFRAMLYLGINCAYGSLDCARLTRATIAAEPGWLDSPRVKTGADRRCPLWPETIAALDNALTVRPEPKRDEDEDLAFLTVQGNPWVRETDRGTDKAVSRVDTVAANFARVAEKCGLDLPGGFYLLRHTFRTVADEVRDTPAARLIMGHTGTTIDDTYRERIGDDRLLAVTEHVRTWLLARLA
jgi:integrase